MRSGEQVEETQVEPPRITLGKMQNPVRGFLHGTAALVAVVGAVLLLMRAPSWPSRIALLVFGAGLVALFTTSSLYHSVPWRERWKARMQRLDHSMIFLLIAGTYTPVAAFGLDGTWRWATLLVVWGITAVGVGQHVFFPRSEQRFSIVLMMVFGWLGVFVALPFAQRAGTTPMVLIAVGGVLYTIGVVIMVTGRPRLWPRIFSSHEVFHVFVVAASAVHYVMTYRYLVPLAA